MPRSTMKFISGYLIPSLNSERFGNRLKWLNQEKAIFQIDWCHKRGPKWSEEEAAVFVEWDKCKGHYNPGCKTYFTESKQRFRAMLYKLTCEGCIQELKSNNKFIKIYCIAEQCQRRRRRQRSSCSSSEYEREEIIDDGGDSLDSDVCRRRVSEDNTINVLEDHAYIPAYCMSDINSGVSNRGVENEVKVLTYDTSIPSSFYGANESLNKVTVMYNSNSRSENVPKRDIHFLWLGKVIEDHESSFTTDERTSGIEDLQKYNYPVCNNTFFKKGEIGNTEPYNWITLNKYDVDMPDLNSDIELEDVKKAFLL